MSSLMDVVTIFGDVFTVTFTPHTYYLSIQSKSHVKAPQLVLGSRLRSLLGIAEEKFTYEKTTISELTIIHQVLFKIGVKVKESLFSETISGFCSDIIPLTMVNNVIYYISTDIVCILYLWRLAQSSSQWMICAFNNGL